jgi:hypothetical protein
MRCRLVGAYFDFGSWVIAHAGVTQERKEKTRQCKIYVRSEGFDPAWQR